MRSSDFREAVSPLASRHALKGGGRAAPAKVAVVMPVGALGSGLGEPPEDQQTAVIRHIEGAAANLDHVAAQLRQIPGIDRATLEKGLDAIKVGIKLTVVSLAHTAFTAPHHVPEMMDRLHRIGRR